LLRVTPEAIETLFTRDHDGNRLRVEWGEAGADGFHDPVISVDYTDNIHAADKATIATLRAQYAAQLNRTIEANSTIATLRAALDGLVAAAEPIVDMHPAVDIVTGLREQVVILRAALATAKETP
jgi:hypothetical protein